MILRLPQPPRAAAAACCYCYRMLPAAACRLLLHAANAAAACCMLHACMLLLLHAAAIAHTVIAHRHCPLPPPTATAHRHRPPPTPTDIAHHHRLIIVDSGSSLRTGTFRGFLLWECPRPLNSQRNKNSQREGKPSPQARCHPPLKPPIAHRHHLLQSLTTTDHCRLDRHLIRYHSIYNKLTPTYHMHT